MATNIYLLPRLKDEAINTMQSQKIYSDIQSVKPAVPDDGSFDEYETVKAEDLDIICPSATVLPKLFKSTYNAFGQYIFDPTGPDFGSSAWKPSHVNLLPFSQPSQPQFIVPVGDLSGQPRQNRNQITSEQGTLEAETVGNGAVKLSRQDVAREVAAWQETYKIHFRKNVVQHFQPSHQVLLRKVIQELTNDFPMKSQARYDSFTKSLFRALTMPDTEGQGDLIHESENTCVWVLGLPANITYRELLSSTLGGKVYCSVIYPPTGEHGTSAAKVAFFNRSAAEEYIIRATTKRVFVRGTPVRAFWNRVRYAPYLSPTHSRVLNITGPAHLMSFEFFIEFLNNRIVYDVDSCFEVHCLQKGFKTHVWRFGSLRGQSELAKIAIERELGPIGFAVHWGFDPCAAAWPSTSMMQMLTL